MAALLALMGSVLWGTADFMGGSLSKRHKAITVVGVTQLIGLSCGILMLLATRTWQAPTLSLHGYFIPGVLAGLCGFIGLIAFYKGLATGRMGVVSPISSLAALIPVIVAMAGGEKPLALQLLGMTAALIGIFLVSGPEVKGGFPVKPLVLGFVAATGFGLALTFMAQGSKTNALLTMTSMRAASSTVIIVLSVISRQRGEFTKAEIPTLLFVGSADFVANVLTGLAVNHGMVSVVMVLASIFPLVTVVWSFLIFHERLQKIQYAGAVVALAGVAMISVGGA